MKKLLFPLFLITFFSCDQVQSINSKGAKSNSKYYSLLLQYNNIGIDTLLVYSPEDSSDAWSGRALDSLNALFFPEDMAKRHFSEPPGLFASWGSSPERLLTMCLLP
jgi:hypothetical protein